MNNSTFAKAAIWLVIAVVLFTVFQKLEKGTGGSIQSIPYSQFINEVRAGHVKSARIQETSPGMTEVVATTAEGTQLRTTGTLYDRGIFLSLIHI